PTASPRSHPTTIPQAQHDSSRIESTGVDRRHRTRRAGRGDLPHTGQAWTWIPRSRYHGTANHSVGGEKKQNQVGERSLVEQEDHRAADFSETECIDLSA